ncbi:MULTISPECIES: uridine kinase family protein [Streptomyces]|jgi:uridine kinase|uniref:uridine kinase family protein n=1 Tax=Streptomyces TaxID=1883 RepID=UPI000BCF6C81|nr:Uridine kinase [Streptomyces sp. OV198]
MTCEASVPVGARRPPLECSPYRGACARRADAPASRRTSGTVIRDLAARLRALPPSCGPVRLIGVDGHAGSGKTTFAGRLAAALGDAPVLHLDDIATHEELFGWTRRLLRQVVEPLSRGETARYVPYDWSARAFGPVRELPPAPVILLEGVGAGRRALRPYLARLLWMELARDEAWTRGRRRDGEAQSAFWAGWVAAERQHFVEDPSKPFADLLVRQCSEGYEVLSGPTGTAGPDQPLTHGDGSSAMC